MTRTGPLLLLAVLLGTTPALAQMTARDVLELGDMSAEEVSAKLAEGMDPNTRVQGEPMLSRLIGSVFEDAQLQVIRVLVEAGADVNAEGALGHTPFLQLLMFGPGDAVMTAPMIELFLAHGARMDHAVAADFDGDGVPDAEKLLPLATILTGGRKEARARIVMAIEKGARFDPPTGATFATPFFWAANQQDDGTLAGAFLKAGAQPCFFPTQHAEIPVRMFDGVTRPQSAVWDIQWEDALEWGLEKRLAAHPGVLADLLATRGLCPVDG